MNRLGGRAMTLNEKVIKSAIESAVRSLKEKDISPRDVAFHMTDWLVNLERYYDFCVHPEKYSADEIARILTDFLIHVPNHVAAASKLLTGIPVSDLFGVGAVEAEKRSKCAPKRA